MLAGGSPNVSSVGTLAADCVYDRSVDAFDLFRIDKRLNNVGDNWTADSNCVMDNAGLICIINGVDYYKTNIGKALVGTIHYNGGGGRIYTGPILVSTDRDAVTYTVSGTDNLFSNYFDYLGIRWWVSAHTDYQQGEYDSFNCIGEYDDMTVAAKTLIDAANTSVTLG